MRILVTYASCHGSTAEIAEGIADRLQATGDTVACRPVSEVERVEDFRDWKQIGAWTDEVGDDIHRCGQRSPA